MIETALHRTPQECRVGQPWWHFTVAGIIALVFLAVLPTLMNMRDHQNDPKCNESHDTFVVQIAHAATPQSALPIICVQDNVLGEVHDVLPPRGP